MRALLLPFRPRYILLTIALAGTAAFAAAAWRNPDSLPHYLLPIAFFGAFAVLGLRDLMQRRHAILRNYPIAAHLRFILENVRPELRQYFFESDKEGMPFPRDKCAIVYQRAKHELDKRPFGTHYDVYRTEYEWLHHSMAPKPVTKEPFRILIGGSDCRHLYSASVFNISAMSFGSISANAIRSLNKGARLGGFAHDTGEGGFSPYHREHGGDIIWEIGTGYFGCRNKDGSFSPERFAETAVQEQIKMIEIKLSQGAKPGLGGILPAAKVTREIARIRLVERGKDCVSPARHAAFSTPIEMMQFIAELRRLSGGKPTGFKLCVGHPWEFLALLKAMLETGITPDFIVVDGTEGGTGAAPLEFIDHMGMPRWIGLRAFGARRCRCARPHQARGFGQDHLRFRHGARHGVGRRLVQFRPRLHVRGGLHPGADLPYGPLPHGSCYPGPDASARNRRHRQIAARGELPQADGEGAGRAGSRRGPQPSRRVSSAPLHASRRPRSRRHLCRAVPLPRPGRAAARNTASPLCHGLAYGIPAFLRCSLRSIATDHAERCGIGAAI